jgi:uncharacterized protein YeaO (DUF488 family)
LIRPKLAFEETVMKIQIKRVYEGPTDDDGRRILVDRLWPRGLSKEKAKVDFWARSISPSTELRRWYHHDPAMWEEFKARYFSELDANPDGVQELLNNMRFDAVTFLYSSKERHLNNAVALKEYAEPRL